LKFDDTSTKAGLNKSDTLSSIANSTLMNYSGK